MKAARSGYNVVCNRNSDGTYRFSYGRGGKKILAAVANRGKVWEVINGAARGLVKASLRDLKEVWEFTAKSLYDGITSPAEIEEQLEDRHDDAEPPVIHGRPDNLVDLDGVDPPRSNVGTLDDAIEVTIKRPVRRPPLKGYADWRDHFDALKFENLCEIYGTAFLIQKLEAYAAKEGI